MGHHGYIQSWVGRKGEVLIAENSSRHTLDIAKFTGKCQMNTKCILTVVCLFVTNVWTLISIVHPLLKLNIEHTLKHTPKHTGYLAQHVLQPVLQPPKHFIMHPSDSCCPNRKILPASETTGHLLYRGLPNTNSFKHCTYKVNLDLLVRHKQASIVQKYNCCIFFFVQNAAVSSFLHSHMDTLLYVFVYFHKYIPTILHVELLLSTVVTAE